MTKEKKTATRKERKDRRRSQSPQRLPFANQNDPILPPRVYPPVPNLVPPAPPLPLLNDTLFEAPPNLLPKPHPGCIRPMRLFNDLPENPNVYALQRNRFPHPPPPVRPVNVESMPHIQLPNAAPVPDGRVRPFRAATQGRMFRSANLVELRYRVNHQRPSNCTNAFVFTELAWMIQAAWGHIQVAIMMNLLDQSEMDEIFARAQLFLNLDSPRNVTAPSFDLMLDAMRYMLTLWNLPNDNLANEINRRMELVIYFIRNVYKDPEQAVLWIMSNWNKIEENEEREPILSSNSWHYSEGRTVGVFPNDVLNIVRLPIVSKKETTSYNNPLDLLENDNEDTTPSLEVLNNEVAAATGLATLAQQSCDDNESAVAKKPIPNRVARVIANFKTRHDRRVRRVIQMMRRDGIDVEALGYRPSFLQSRLNTDGVRMPSMEEIDQDRQAELEEEMTRFLKEDLERNEMEAAALNEQENPDELMYDPFAHTTPAMNRKPPAIKRQMEEPKDTDNDEDDTKPPAKPMDEAMDDDDIVEANDEEDDGMDIKLKDLGRCPKYEYDV